ncbi:LysR family transcriptional regulator [Alcaligenaceae bacterium]|nr:LysR family transcriptional regulator [Alcaligenaceae bacterium]
MDTGWFYDFLALIETGNFTQAASFRNCSQAAFSRRIQNLENWAGAKLIDRSVYPMQLTRAGEKFHQSTLRLTSQLEDARAELGLHQASHNIKVALTYALGTEKLPSWWKQWSSRDEISCSTLIGNILETTSAFTSGLADILISYSHPLYPGFRLEEGLYEKIVIGTDTLAPYGSKELVNSSGFEFPGTPDQPIPLLNYSIQSYFSKVVQHILDSSEAELHSKIVFESEMSSILAKAAQQGLGVAWLTGTSALHDIGPALRPLDATAAQMWSQDLDIVAYRAHANRRKHVLRLWAAMREAG